MQPLPRRPKTPVTPGLLALGFRARARLSTANFRSLPVKYSATATYSHARIGAKLDGVALLGPAGKRTPANAEIVKSLATQPKPSSR